MRLVAVAFSVLAASILAIRAFFTATQLDGPGWAVVCAWAALSTVAAAVAVARGSAWALPGVALAALLAAVVEVVPVAPATARVLARGARGGRGGSGVRT